MRARLLAAFVGLTLLTVLVYGVPRAYVRAGGVQDEAQRDVTRTAAVVAEVVAARRTAGLDPAAGLAVLDPQDEVLLADADGTERVIAGPDLGAVERAEAVTATAPVPGGGSVTVVRPRAVVREDVVRALQPIVLLGAASLCVAVLLGLVLSRRMVRPFALLADRAADVGRGGSLDLPRQRVREAEAIASALRASSARISGVLARERAFARNASHQLRTPLTGIRLRVEDLSLWPETPAPVRAELEEVLGEVDRLTATVTALLAFSRDEALTDAEDVRPVDLLSAAAGRWRALASAAGRDVLVEEAGPDPVPVPRNAVDQVLDVLVDNALRHGRGTVRLRAATAEGRLRLCVADEGEVPAGGERELFTRRSGGRGAGEGIGLSLCAQLATALGGGLRLAERSPTTFELTVPLAVTTSGPA